MSVSDLLGTAPRLVALGVLTLVLGSAALAEDEPGVLGRLFRRPPPPRPAPTAPPASRTPGTGSANGPAFGATPSLLPPSTPAPSLPGAGGVPTAGPATPELPDAPGAPRLRPQPRVSRAATEADPVLTRIALGRSDDGAQFGMFLQVYADGTVIDGEGVRRVGADAMRPLLLALQAPELGRVRGHCGSPPADFIEQVHVTVYERKYGGLRANSFSYSGDPKGCDPSVGALHAAVEALAARLSSPGNATTPTPTTAPVPAAAPAPITGPAAAPLGTPVPPVLSLSPVN
jgi:hypothetical protein